MMDQAGRSGSQQSLQKLRQQAEDALKRQDDISRKVDEILRRAILEGARLPLDQAVELEAKCFGEAFATRDCRIGLDNFLKTNLKQPANFVHA